MSKKFSKLIRLLDACRGYAPTEEARLGFSFIYDDMICEHEPYEKIAAALAMQLMDGLNYGNWPSVPIKSVPALSE